MTSPKKTLSGTTIHYQSTSGDTVGGGTFQINGHVDLGAAHRLAEQHAGAVSVDLTAVYTPDGRDLVGEWEAKQAAGRSELAPTPELERTGTRGQL